MSEKRGELKRLAVFAAVAEGGGFTAAAERLGSTKAMVSAQVRRLEAELGATLFTRTTRRVTLTEAGRQLFEQSTPLLRELEAVLDRVGGDGSLRGTLRLTVPGNYLASGLGAQLARFAVQHPQLQLDLLATDDVLDLVGEGIDLAIRGGLGLADSTLRAVRLGQFEQWIVAAPAYLARHGLPRQPQDLADHRWVALSLLRAPLTWTFSKGGARRVVRTQAVARCNTPTAVQELVREGLGVSALTDYMVRADVGQGRLVRLLPGWTLPSGGIHAVYPATRHVPAKVRALIDFLRQGSNR
jgi:DNA-binding transcriptional LysR family regulator